MRCTECSREVKPVVAVDIDGTLGDYHEHFIIFAQGYVGRRLSMNHGGDGEFSDSLGLEKHEYRAIKLAYRQGGMKRSMPVYPYAPDLVTRLREAGAEVWLTTTRPYLRLDNIDPDTRAWLERHEISYDGLLYDDDKYTRLLEIVDRDRIIGVVDDQASMIHAAVEHGLAPIQRWTHWNRNARRQPGSDQLLVIMRVLLERLHTWRKNFA